MTYPLSEEEAAIVEMLWSHIQMLSVEKQNEVLRRLESRIYRGYD